MTEQSSQTKFINVGVLAVLVLAGGTLGYAVIEGWSLLDAFYMTIITVTTIGYGEIRPLSDTGRVFTIFVALFGVGTVAYAVGQFSRLMVEISLREILGRNKLQKKINALRGHYIICGFGRIGRVTAQELRAKGLDVVIVDNNPAVISELDETGFLHIQGEATDDDNLLAAGIERARGIITVVSSDADNVYIVLTARAMNEKLFIVSRASEEKSVAKLKRAGANKVISPYQIGARKMAQTVIRPAISDFIDNTLWGGSGEQLAMEEMLVTGESRIKDVSLMESNIRRDLDLIVIAIKTAEGRMIFNPSAAATVRVGDTLIAVGLAENMEKLARLLGADRLAPDPTL